MLVATLYRMLLSYPSNVITDVIVYGSSVFFYALLPRRELEMTLRSKNIHTEVIGLEELAPESSDSKRIYRHQFFERIYAL